MALPKTQRACQIQASRSGAPRADSPRSRADRSSRLWLLQEQGDLDVIQVREIPVPTPGKGQVLYKVEYAG